MSRFFFLDSFSSERPGAQGPGVGETRDWLIRKLSGLTCLLAAALHVGQRDGRSLDLVGLVCCVLFVTQPLGAQKLGYAREEKRLARNDVELVCKKGEGIGMKKEEKETVKQDKTSTGHTSQERAAVLLTSYQGMDDNTKKKSNKEKMGRKRKKGKCT